MKTVQNRYKVPLLCRGCLVLGLWPWPEYHEYKERLEQKVQAVFEEKGEKAARRVAWEQSLPWLKVGAERVGRKFRMIGKVVVFLWRIGS